MSEPEIERVLWAFRERMLDLKQDRRLRYILVFKNHGAAAGRDARAPALAADRAADRAATSCARRSTARGGTSRRRSAASSATSSGRRLRDGAARDPGERRHRRARAVRAAVPVRDLAAAAAARRAVRGRAAARVREPGAAAQGGAAAASTGRSSRRRTTSHPHRRRSPRTSTDFYHWHVEIMPKLTRVGRLRVGDRVLHQPDVARRSGAGAARVRLRRPIETARRFGRRRLKPTRPCGTLRVRRAGITQW